MKVLLFGGTTEGRVLAEWLLGQGIDHLVSVATDYGKTLVSSSPVQVGRMTKEDMEGQMAEGFTHVIDATHPYATEVSQNLKQACETASLPYLRLLRNIETEGDWIQVESSQEALERLQTMEGNILLTTGAKDLPIYTPLANRCYPRVLPMESSLKACAGAGIPPKQIICMQGPFSLEMNCALLRQFQIQILLSKYTGTQGGFQEKVEACKQCHCEMMVIAPPIVETGLSFEEVKDALKRSQ